MKSQAETEAEVRSWGFGTVYTWTDRPFVRRVSILVVACPDCTFLRNAYYAPHIHPGLTTHVILRGTFTVTFPDDENATKETHGVGARIDVAARQRHEVWIGPEGCTYVIGE